MSRWLIVEDQTQLESIIANPPEAGEKVLALTPGAVTCCERLGWTTVGIDHYSHDSELNELARQNFDAVGEAVRRLGSAWEALRPSDLRGYDPFAATAYLLKLASDSYTFRLRELRTFADVEDPGSVRVLAGRGREGPASGASPSSYHTALVPELAESVAFPLLVSGALGDQVEITRAGSDSASCGARVAGGWRVNMGRAVNPNRISLGKFLLRRKVPVHWKKGCPVVVVATGDDCVQRFADFAVREHGCRVGWWIHWDRSPVSSRLLLGESVGLGWRGALPLDDLSAAARELLDNDLWDVDGSGAARRVLVRRLDWFVTRRVPYLVDLYTRARHYFEATKPLAFLTGASSSDASHTLSRAAKNSGVPHVVFQHGGCYGYCQLPTINHSDLQVASIFAAWGDGVVEDLKIQKPDPPRPTVLNCGWPGGTELRFGAATQGPPSYRESPTAAVLYVTTGLHGNLRYGPHHSPNDLRYVDMQVDVIDTLSTLGLGEIWVKLHYKDKTTNPLRMRTKQGGDRGVRILQEGPFTDLLPMASVVLLDYASTTLLQALAAGRPVVLLDQGVHEYSRRGERALRSAARLVRRSSPSWKEELAAAVRDAHSMGPLAGSEHFLNLYGEPGFHPEVLWRELQRGSTSEAPLR